MKILMALQKLLNKWYSKHKIFLCFKLLIIINQEQNGITLHTKLISLFLGILKLQYYSTKNSIILYK